MSVERQQLSHVAAFGQTHQKLGQAVEICRERSGSVDVCRTANGRRYTRGYLTEHRASIEEGQGEAPEAANADG